MDKIDTEILPVKEKISNLIVVLDSVISSVDEILNAEFKKRILSRNTFKSEWYNSKP